MSRQLSSVTELSGIIEDVNISQIAESFHSLRSDSRSEIRDLCESIKQRGLLHAIIVRIKNEGIYEIVAGNRRFMACKALGWRKIPSQIIEIDDRGAFELSLIENIQRKTLYPIEEANAFRKYVCDFGWGGTTGTSTKNRQKC